MPILQRRSACSKKDFLSKMYIAFKECAETLYWLELLESGNYITEKEYTSLKNDCCEIRKILASITKSTAESLNKTNIN